MGIKYLKGDATSRIGEGKKAIIHVSNCNNGWGRGFVLAISAKWKQPELEYRRLFYRLNQEQSVNLLGHCQFVSVEENVTVVNMIAQKGYGKNNLQKHRTDEPDTETPLQLWALEECLEEIAIWAKDNKVSIHGPRFGAGLSGGNWKDIEKLINKHMSDIDVFIYDLK